MIKIMRATNYTLLINWKPNRLQTEILISFLLAAFNDT